MLAGVCEVVASRRSGGRSFCRWSRTGSCRLAVLVPASCGINAILRDPLLVDPKRSDQPHRSLLDLVAALVILTALLDCWKDRARGTGRNAIVLHRAVIEPSSVCQSEVAHAELAHAERKTLDPQSSGGSTLSPFTPTSSPTLLTTSLNALQAGESPKLSKKLSP